VAPIDSTAADDGNVTPSSDDSSVYLPTIE